MKKQGLEIVAKLAEKCVKVSNNSVCCWWSYQPKAPKNVKSFKK